MTEENELKSKHKEPVFTYISLILFIGQIVLCFIRFNYLEIRLMLYSGFILLLIGLFGFGRMARRCLEKEAGAEERRWIDSKKVVDTGIFGIVRHPVYLGMMFIVVSLVLISQHWVSLILGVPSVIYLYYSMVAEERINVEKFGDDYSRYMEKVPRMNFLSGIIKTIRKE